MEDFEIWWLRVVIELHRPRTIRNWTADGGLLGGKFKAVSYGALPKDTQEALCGGYPLQNPTDWIICEQLNGGKLTKVSKKEFHDRWGKWRSYRTNGITRQHFGGENTASPYLISLFNEFDPVSKLRE